MYSEVVDKTERFGLFNKDSSVKVDLISFFTCLQILQSIANHVLFTKEEHMRPFNDFVKSNFDAARR